jgi:hypothetical protein
MSAENFDCFGCHPVRNAISKLVEGPLHYIAPRIFRIGLENPTGK